MSQRGKKFRELRPSMYDDDHGDGDCDGDGKDGLRQRVLRLIKRTKPRACADEDHWRVQYDALWEAYVQWRRAALSQKPIPTATEDDAGRTLLKRVHAMARSVAYGGSAQQRQLVETLAGSLDDDHAGLALGWALHVVGAVCIDAVVQRAVAVAPSQNQRGIYVAIARQWTSLLLMPLDASAQPRSVLQSCGQDLLLHWPQAAFGGRSTAQHALQVLRCLCCDVLLERGSALLEVVERVLRVVQQQWVTKGTHSEIASRFVHEQLHAFVTVSVEDGAITCTDLMLDKLCRIYQQCIGAEQLAQTLCQFLQTKVTDAPKPSGSVAAVDRHVPEFVVKLLRLFASRDTEFVSVMFRAAHGLLEQALKDWNGRYVFQCFDVIGAVDVSKPSSSGAADESMTSYECWVQTHFGYSQPDREQANGDVGDQRSSRCSTDCVVTTSKRQIEFLAATITEYFQVGHSIATHAMAILRAMKSHQTHVASGLLINCCAHLRRAYDSASQGNASSTVLTETPSKRTRGLASSSPFSATKDARTRVKDSIEFVKNRQRLPKWWSEWRLFRKQELKQDIIPCCLEPPSAETTDTAGVADSVRHLQALVKEKLVSQQEYDQYLVQVEAWVAQNAARTRKVSRKRRRLPTNAREIEVLDCQALRADLFAAIQQVTTRKFLGLNAEMHTDAVSTLATALQNAVFAMSIQSEDQHDGRRGATPAMIVIEDALLHWSSLLGQLHVSISSQVEVWSRAMESSDAVSFQEIDSLLRDYIDRIPGEGSLESHKSWCASLFSLLAVFGREKGFGKDQLDALVHQIVHKLIGVVVANSDKCAGSATVVAVNVFLAMVLAARCSTSTSMWRITIQDMLKAHRRLRSVACWISYRQSLDVVQSFTTENTSADVDVAADLLSDMAHISRDPSIDNCELRHWTKEDFLDIVGVDLLLMIVLSGSNRLHQVARDILALHDDCAAQGISGNAESFNAVVDFIFDSASKRFGGMPSDAWEIVTTVLSELMWRMRSHGAPGVDVSEAFLELILQELRREGTRTRLLWERAFQLLAMCEKTGGPTPETQVVMSTLGQQRVVELLHLVAATAHHFDYIFLSTDAVATLWKLCAYTTILQQPLQVPDPVLAMWAIKTGHRVLDRLSDTNTSTAWRIVRRLHALRIVLSGSTAPALASSIMATPATSRVTDVAELLDQSKWLFVWRKPIKLPTDSVTSVVWLRAAARRFCEHFMLGNTDGSIPQWSDDELGDLVLKVLAAWSDSVSTSSGNENGLRSRAFESFLVYLACWVCLRSTKATRALLQACSTKQPSHHSVAIKTNNPRLTMLFILWILHAAAEAQNINQLLGQHASLWLLQVTQMALELAPTALPTRCEATIQDSSAILQYAGIIDAPVRAVLLHTLEFAATHQVDYLDPVLPQRLVRRYPDLRELIQSVPVLVLADDLIQDG